MGTLRFLLALSVLIVHSSPILGIQLLPGPVAVRAFYIISGFLISMVITQKYQNLDRPYYYFISNRFLRLYPLYITVVIMTVILSTVYGLILGDWGKLQYYFNYYQASPQSLETLCVVMLTNITLLGQDLMTFVGIDPNTGRFFFHKMQDWPELQELLFIPIAWTVAVEFYFYLVAPFFVSKKVKTIICLIILVLIFRYWLYVSGAAPNAFAIYRFAPTEIYWFLLGVLSYRLKFPAFITTKKAAYVYMVVFLLLMLTYNHWAALGDSWKNVLVYTLTFISLPSLFAHFAKNKLDKFLGDLCYPVYLLHAFVLLIVAANSFPKTYGTGFPTFILTITFSILLNKYLLVPIEKWRQLRIKSNNVSFRDKLKMVFNREKESKPTGPYDQDRM